VAPFGQGRMTVEEIVAKLDKSAAARQAETLKTKAPFDVLIWAAVRPAPRRRCMPRARASARAS